MTPAQQAIGASAMRPTHTRARARTQDGIGAHPLKHVHHLFEVCVVDSWLLALCVDLLQPLLIFLVHFVLDAWRASPLNLDQLRGPPAAQIGCQVSVHPTTRKRRQENGREMFGSRAPEAPLRQLIPVRRLSKLRHYDRWSRGRPTARLALLRRREDDLQVFCEVKRSSPDLARR